MGHAFKKGGPCIQKWEAGGRGSGETKQQPPKKRSVTTVSGCPPCGKLGVLAPVFKVRMLKKQMNHKESDFIKELVHSWILNLMGS